MGMGTAPNIGYLLLINEKTLKCFRKDIIRDVNKYILENRGGEPFSLYTPLDDIRDILEEIAREQGCITLNIGGKDVNADVYNYNEENGDRYDSLLEYGDVSLFLWFGEDDLYDKKLTPLGKTLKKQGRLPKYESWTTFG